MTVANPKAVATQLILTKLVPKLSGTVLGKLLGTTVLTTLLTSLLLDPNVLGFARKIAAFPFQSKKLNKKQQNELNEAIKRLNILEGDATERLGNLEKKIKGTEDRLHLLDLRVAAVEEKSEIKKEAPSAKEEIKPVNHLSAVKKGDSLRVS